MTRLHSLSDLSSLFGGPGAQTLATKNPATAEAARGGDIEMFIVDERGAEAKVESAAPTENYKDRERKRVETWIKRNLEDAQDEPVTLTTTLTPIMAEALLARNPDNRRASPDVVERYTRDIIAGRWSFNGQTVVISRDGLLNDGQHRCMAVVAAGRTVRTVIVFGPERETRLTLDQNKVRTSADYVAMMGRPDAVSYSAVAGYIWQHREHGKLSAQSLYRPTKAEVLLVVESFGDIGESMSAIPHKGFNTLGGRSLLAFCHWVFSRKAGQDAATTFMKALVEGAELGPRDPILYARNRLMAERGRMKANEKAELIFRAWNAHRRRETPRTLVISNSALPTVER